MARICSSGDWFRRTRNNRDNRSTRNTQSILNNWNMFTGIIEEVGHVKALHRGAKSFTLEVETDVVVQDAQVGDSIATNGVCLTVTSISEHGFTADVMPETVERTALGQLKPGSPVNLERAL